MIIICQNQQTVSRSVRQVCNKEEGSTVQYVCGRNCLKFGCRILTWAERACRFSALETVDRIIKGIACGGGLADYHKDTRQKYVLLSQKVCY